MNNSQFQSFEWWLCLAEGMTTIAVLRDLLKVLYFDRNILKYSLEEIQTSPKHDNFWSDSHPILVFHIQKSSTFFHVSSQLIFPHQLLKMTYVKPSASGTLLSVAAFLFNFSSTGNSSHAELYLGY